MARAIDENITEILKRWNDGEKKALQDVMVKVYHDLRSTAGRLLAGESHNQTLQTTALIHEVYLRIDGVDRMQFQNRRHFFWFTGQLMRRILCEHARAKLRKKRAGSKYPVTLDEALELPANLGLDPEILLSLDNALNKLKTLDPRQSQIVEMRFFAGLKSDEIQALLGISASTMKRDWRLAKLWLARELSRNLTE